MRIEFTSHYAKLERLARENNCTSMSVQNARIFFNFRDPVDAAVFMAKAQPLVTEQLYINTERGGGYIPAEVSIPHKKWIY